MAGKASTDQELLRTLIDGSTVVDKDGNPVHGGNPTPTSDEELHVTLKMMISVLISIEHHLMQLSKSDLTYKDFTE